MGLFVEIACVVALWNIIFVFTVHQMTNMHAGKMNFPNQNEVLLYSFIMATSGTAFMLLFWHLIK